MGKIRIIFLISLYCSWVAAAESALPDVQENSGQSLSYACPAIERSHLGRMTVKAEPGTITRFDFSAEPGVVLPSQSVQSRLAHYYNELLHPYFAKNLPGFVQLKTIEFIFTEKIGPDALYCSSEQTDAENFMFIYVKANQAQNLEALVVHLAHELTHHYFLLRKASAPLWVEEGVALLVEVLATRHEVSGPARTHLDSPWVSLVEFQKSENAASAYGHNMLFLYYLHQQVGNGFLRKFLSGGVYDIEGFQKVLRESETSPWNSLGTAFVDFEIAKRINRYDYHGFDRSRGRFVVMNALKRAADRVHPTNMPLVEWSSQVIAAGPVRFVMPSETLPSGGSQPVRRKKNAACYIVRDSQREAISYQRCGNADLNDLPEDSFAIEIVVPRHLMPQLP